MVSITIHITEEQAKWLDERAYNTSKYVWKILNKIINGEVSVEAGIKTKA